MGAVTLHTSQAETTNGQSSPFTVDNQLVGMFVNISVVSGILPTLIVQLQDSPNGTDWYNVNGIVNGTAISVAGLLNILPSSGQLIAENVRVLWTIGGVNPSFTFEVELETL